MAFDSYDDVAGLSIDALRALSKTGDPRDRVLAGWALGLTLGAGYSREAVGRADTEPSAGARRHLIVMLAGWGEVGILEALAEFDPDERVRATACRYLLRIGACVDKVTARRTSDPSPWVRAAIASEIAPPEPRARTQRAPKPRSPYLPMVID